MKKLFIVILMVVFLSGLILPGYSYSLMPDYLCEIGIRFYNDGRYTEAMQEFQKVLQIEANYAPALKYIRKIQELESKQVINKEGVEPDLTDMNIVSDLERDVLIEKSFSSLGVVQQKTVQVQSAQLNELLAKLNGPLEIEQGQTTILYGNGIQRFLLTENNVVNVERKSSAELSLTGNNIGYTYLHIWDANGRHTLEILTVPERFKGESLGEKMRKDQERERNFKLNYSLDWSSYSSGRGLTTLKRSTYSYVHNLGLTGQTPYGDIDSSIAVNRFNTKTDLTHYTLGLTNGQYGDFKNFTLRAFDFFDIPPRFSNLSFPGTPLRGFMASSPAFNNKLNYTAFYGKENWSGYASLAPDLLEERKAYQEGFNVGLTPTDKQNYKFTFIHGWGKDRDPELKAYGYDLMGDWVLDKWKVGYELANDTENFANLLSAHFAKTNFSFDAQLRDISKEFVSIAGSGWNQGQLGGLFTFNFLPFEKLEVYSSLDVYKDRLYPASAGDDQYNQDFNWNANYKIDPLTNLRFNYTLQNELGRVSQYRFQSIDTGINRTIKFFKDINLFANFYHQENSNFSSPSSDYINERVYAGLKLNFTRDLYYYLNEEINWLTDKSSDTQTLPRAFETGIDWSGQLGKSPFFGAMRFTYRDEQDTLSKLSFFSGEDYIEGYSELSFRPTPDTQIYGSCRIRNVWADNPNVSKHIEANFNAGLRYLWDTGFSWQAVGDIEGYVFKDINADGIMSRDEAPVEGVKVWLGKDRSLVTDVFGYFKFKKVKGNKVYVILDTATLPNGFVLTVPATREVLISQHKVVGVDFGINSRSEVFGYVYEDVNEDNQFNKGDKVLRNAVIVLEDGSKRLTDNSGKYSFSNIKPGEHSIALDLNSIPIYYLPKTALTKKITLFEGVAYNYNIALKRVQE